MGLEKIRIDDILDESNSYFHFTNEQNLYDSDEGIGIINGGLSSLPRNRPHVVGGDEENPCIYFVQGFGGILELMDVWIRYEYSKLVINENYPPGHIKVDEEGMEKAYQIFYDKLKSSKYLKLDLQEGYDPKTSDFNPNEEDLKKKRYFRNSIYHDENFIDNEFAKWAYGENTDYSVATVDRWNMTTHLGNGFKKVIPSEKIQIIQDREERTDALSVVLEIYEKYKQSARDIEDLDKFIKYVKEKNLIEKHQISCKIVKMIR